MLDRTTPPPFITTKSIDFQWPTTYQLTEHIPLFVLNAGSQPMIELEIVCLSGSWYEAVGGVAYFTAKMLLEGTQNKSAQEIATFIDQYGATIDTHVQADFFSISLTTLSKHLAPMLSVLAELLLEATFPADPLERLKNIKQQAIKVADSKNDQIAHKKFRAMLFTEQHPYGTSLREAHVTAITTDHIKAYHAKKLLAGASLFMSGQVTPTDVELAKQYLAPIFTSNFHNKQTHTLPFCVPQQIRIEKEGSLQATISVGKRLVTKDHPDYLSLRVVNELLGGYFGSRLMRNIREEKGYTYGIHSNIISYKQSSYLCIATEVIHKYAKQTCEEINKEIKLLQTTLVPLEELRTLRNYMLGNFLSTINDPFSIMKRFQTAYLYGLGEDYYHKFYDTVQHITPEQIKKLTQQYLAVDTLSSITVG